MELLLKLGVFLVMAAIGFWRGTRNERAHLQWLAEEEKRLADVLVFATRYPPRMDRTMDPVLVTGSVVVGSDFFRLLIAGLRKVVGGNYRSYERLMDRARRHALVRLKAEARQHGARMVFNVRYTGSGIANARGGESAQVEMLAYGTAFVPARGSVAASRVQHQPGTHITEHDGQTDLMKNPASRWWVVGWLVGVAYCLGELLTDRLWAHAWRYIDGAPWLLFGVLALVLTATLVANGRRHRLRWAESLMLGLLTAPMLTGALYFGALRVNGAILLQGQTPTLYRVTAEHDLRPASTEAGMPLLRMEDDADYWATQAPGSEVRVHVARGLLGFWQYDVNDLRDRLRAYYRRH